MKDTMVNKLVIIGVGLIGGSFALSLRKAGLVKRITGLGRSKENLQHALELGVIDEISDNYSQALNKADLVLLAVPVGQTAEILQKINPHLEPQTIISDVGSTKQNVIAAARSSIPEYFKNFVPAHPIAGAELSGSSAANAELFRDKNLILTPSDETDIDSIESIQTLWKGCGAHTSLMTPYQHDEMLAMTSHLPHILAFTFMNHMLSNSSEKNEDTLLNFAGSGFRDFTRIASSSPEMWKDICLANRRLLLQQIRVYQNELARMNEILEDGDGAALEKFFLNAQITRGKFLKDKH
jgi:prephenate dehydrogenase